MIRFNGVDVPVEDVVEVYFNDHRIIRMLKSMRQINSALSVASFILLIPVLTLSCRSPWTMLTRSSAVVVGQFNGSVAWLSTSSVFNYCTRSQRGSVIFVRRETRQKREKHQTVLNSKTCLLKSTLTWFLCRLKSSAVLAVSYCILASIGLAAVTALLILTLQVCQRPTCEFFISHHFAILLYLL